MCSCTQLSDDDALDSVLRATSNLLQRLPYPPGVSTSHEGNAVRAIPSPQYIPWKPINWQQYPTLSPDLTHFRPFTPSRTPCVSASVLKIGTILTSDSRCSHLPEYHRTAATSLRSPAPLLLFAPNHQPFCIRVCVVFCIPGRHCNALSHPASMAVSAAPLQRLDVAHRSAWVVWHSLHHGPLAASINPPAGDSQAHLLMLVIAFRCPRCCAITYTSALALGCLPVTITSRTSRQSLMT